MDIFVTFLLSNNTADKNISSEDWQYHLFHITVRPIMLFIFNYQSVPTFKVQSQLSDTSPLLTC